MNWTLLKNSLLLSSGVTLLAVVLGWLAALCLAAMAARWRRAGIVTAVLALAMPPFLVVNCWLHFFGYAGIWTAGREVNLYSFGGAPGTIFILALMTWPITLLAVLTAWRKLEPGQLEADPALTGGALIRWLLWPTARSATAQAAVLTFVLALNNFAVPSILQVKVFPAELWVRFNTTFDYAAALAMCWPMILAAVLLWFWLRRKEVSWPRVRGPVSHVVFRRQLGPRWRSVAVVSTLVAVLLSTAVPLLQLGATHRTWSELPKAWAAATGPVWHSFFYAAATASLVIVLGLAGWRLRMGGWLWILFLIPGVLLGILLIYLLNRPPFMALYQSAAVVIIGYALRYLAPGWHGVAHARRAIDPLLADAARMEGGSRWQVFRLAVWPQMASQVAAAWYVVYLLCLWDVETLVLIVPPGGETISLRVFNLLHYGHNAQVNALCLMLLLLAVGPLLLGTMAGGFPRLRMVSTNAAWLALIIPCLLTGCGPAASRNQAPLDSKLFSRVEIIGSRGTGVGEFNKPRSVAVDAEDNLYVVDMTGRVQKFSPEGKFILLWQMEETDLGKPKGMCRDADGNIVVIEPHYSRVNHFSPEGKLARQWGDQGIGEGEIRFPRAAAVNSAGDIWVSEYGAVERVQRFALGPIPNPNTTADAPRIRVEPNALPTRPVAGETNRIAASRTLDLDKFQSARFILSIGGAGEAPGRMNRPEGLGIDDEDHLYVADSCNHRIQVFANDGTFLRAYGQAGSGVGEFSYPYDIRIDDVGRQYVCEFGNSRIQVFDQNDRPIEIIGKAGAMPGEFANPWSIALDSHGNLYVADSQNHRVQKLIRRPKPGTQSPKPSPTLAGLWTLDFGPWTHRR